MNKYSRLRKKIQSEGYYQNRLHLFMDLEKYLKNFKTFKCNPFFVGDASAEVNKKIYERRIHRVQAQVRWYSKKLGI